MIQTIKAINWTYSDTTIYIVFQAFLTHGAYIMVELDRHVDLPKEINLIKEKIATRRCYP